MCMHNYAVGVVLKFPLRVLSYMLSQVLCFMDSICIDSQGSSRGQAMFTQT